MRGDAERAAVHAEGVEVLLVPEGEARLGEGGDEGLPICSRGGQPVMPVVAVRMTLPNVHVGSVPPRSRSDVDVLELVDA